MFNHRINMRFALPDAASVFTFAVWLELGCRTDSDVVLCSADVFTPKNTPFSYHACVVLAGLMQCGADGLEEHENGVFSDFQ